MKRIETKTVEFIGKNAQIEYVESSPIVKLKFREKTDSSGIPDTWHEGIIPIDIVPEIIEVLQKFEKEYLK